MPFAKGARMFWAIFRLLFNYEAAEFWLTFASLAVAVISLLVATIVSIVSLNLSKASVIVGQRSLDLARAVAAREHDEWAQRKWFDLYLEAERFSNLIEHFQTVFDRPLQTLEFETHANEVTFAGRDMLTHAGVFPQNAGIDAVFSCLRKWPLSPQNLLSKQMLAEYNDAIELLRQKALINPSILQR
jgi:hypothetical protein